MEKKNTISAFVRKNAKIGCQCLKLLLSGYVFLFTLAHMRANILILAILVLVPFCMSQKYFLWHWTDNICDREGGSAGQASSDGECIPIDGFSQFNAVGALTYQGYAKITASTYYADCNSMCTTCNYTGPVQLGQCTALVIPIV